MAVREVEGRGRCYFATEALPRGALVVEEEPYAMVTRAPFAEVCCNYCGQLCVGGTVLAVSANDRFRYCSEKCITVDYGVHQHEVVALGRLLGDQASQQFGDSDPSTLIVRIAAKRKLEAAAAPASGGSRFELDVMKLEAAASRIPEAALAMLQKAALRLSVICKLGGLPLSQPEAYHLLLAQQCNAHQILDEADNPVALGLFPRTSMLNHSCVPNCAHSFLLEPGRPPRLVMRTIRDVSAGEELCYNYTPLYASTQARRAALEQCYSFVCDCARCTEGGDEYIDADVVGGEKQQQQQLLARVRAATLALAQPRGSAAIADANALLADTRAIVLGGRVHVGHVAVIQAAAVLARWFLSSTDTATGTDSGPDAGSAESSVNLEKTAHLAQRQGLAALCCIGAVCMHQHCQRGCSASARVHVRELDRLCSDALRVLAWAAAVPEPASPTLALPSAASYAELLLRLMQAPPLPRQSAPSPAPAQSSVPSSSSSTLPPPPRQLPPAAAAVAGGGLPLGLAAVSEAIASASASASEEHAAAPASLAGLRAALESLLGC